MPINFSRSNAFLNEMNRGSCGKNAMYRDGAFAVKSEHVKTGGVSPPMRHRCVHYS